MRWRAWFADGASIASTQSSWSDLPSEFVVILKTWPDDASKAMYCGLDAIWWDGENRVHQLDLPAPFVELAQLEADVGNLKFGKRVADELYERLYEEALTAEAP